VQRADRPYASFYLSFTSTERSVPAVTDWLLRTLQPQLSTLPGVQRVTFEGGRQVAMRIWIDPDRLAALNLSPGDVQAALKRNNFLAAVGRTKGNLVQVNLLANTDLRSAVEFENLIVADRGGAIVRLKDVAQVEHGAEEADMIAKYNGKEGVYLGIWALIGSNEIDVAHRLREEMDRIRPTLPKDIDMQLVWDGTMFMRNALTEISKTLAETILIVALVVFLFMGSVRTALVPLVAMPVSLVGAATFMFAFGFSLNLLTLLAIVLSVGLVVDDAIVVVENVERHVRLGKSRIEAALAGARELIGPIIAMTITLAAVYTPIGFQGGLTGSLFLEFAMTLAVAVVLSGVVAVTLSPVMSSRFVHAQGQEGRLTAFVNRRFEEVRRIYAWLLDRALEMRWAVVAASLLIMVAVWPLYMFSRQELAPVEDQNHISLFFQASPDSTVAATNREHLQVVKTITSFPETEFTWSLTAAWGGFGGLVAKDWHGRARSTEEMYGEVFGAVSQVPGLRVFPRLDPPLPTPGQYDVELVLQSDVPPEQMLETVGAVLGAGWQSGKFMYVDTDLKIDLPEARVVLDRERVADLGLDLAGVGRELGTLLGGAYVNRFNYFDRSYKVIPQIGDKDRATVDPLLNLKTAHTEPIPAAQCGAYIRRRHPRVHKGRSAARPRRRSCCSKRVRRHHRLCGRVTTDPSRGICAHCHARVRGRAHLSGACGAVPELSGPVDRPGRLGSARDFRRADIQLPGPDHDQYLLTGRADYAGRTDCEERHPHRGIRQHVAGPRSLEGRRVARGGVDAAAAGADDLGGHRLRASSSGAGFGAGSRCPQ
jgi:multidrug efflux pump